MADEAIIRVLVEGGGQAGASAAGGTGVPTPPAQPLGGQAPPAQPLGGQAAPVSPSAQRRQTRPSPPSVMLPPPEAFFPPPREPAVGAAAFPVPPPVAAFPERPSTIPAKPPPTPSGAGAFPPMPHDVEFQQPSYFQPQQRPTSPSGREAFPDAPHGVLSAMPSLTLPPPERPTPIPHETSPAYPVPTAQPLSPNEKMLQAPARALLDDAYKGLADKIKKTNPIFDMLMENAEKLRGTLGGVFGSLIGAGLDAASAFRRMKPVPGTPPGEGLGKYAKPAAWSAALWGLPGAASQAYQAGKQGGQPAAVASIASSAVTIGAFKLLAGAAANAVGAVQTFAANLVSPNANPAQFVNTMGSAISGVSSSLFAINPILGSFGMLLGASVTGLSEFMSAMDGMVERYGQYDPAIAQAQAQAEMTQAMNDIRRSREASPDLVKYIQERTDLQQKFEDAKLEIMQSFMPIALNIMAVVEELLPLFTTATDILSVIASLNPISLLGQILGTLRKMSDEDADTAFNEFDILQQVREGYQAPGSNRGVRTPSGV